jgi:tricorn protease
VRRLIPVLLSTFGAAAEHQLFRDPAVNATNVVFSYAGDLWRVPRGGGVAERLTTGPGVESNPAFSPDGSRIAFTGEYDGNVDVFVMAAAGGVPRRLTWHPSPDTVVGWTPDGKRVLFASSRNNPADGARLFTISVEGAFPDEIPLPLAVDGSFSPDGARIAYSPVFQWQPSWKKYRGGQTMKIWIAEVADSAVSEIPRANSNDTNPMWVGDRIYFLSDRGGPVSLYCYDTRTREVKAVVENRGLDFKSASAGAGAIVYEQFGGLHLYDLKTGATRPIDVRVAGDLPEVRPRYASIAKSIQYAGISPNGARALFGARGEVVTVPAEKGDPRNLTNSPGVHDRDPSWSPDGKTIAYFSDESGEYELHLRDQSGTGEPRKIKLADKPVFYLAPVWSPDSARIAYVDAHLGVWYVDVTTGRPVLVDRDNRLSGRNLAPVWSPDSKWLAYSKQLANHMSAIYLYSLADAKATQITDGMSEARMPVFDKDGKHLYFAASTDSGPAMQPDILSRAYSVTSSLYAVVLARDLPSPLAPQSDEEKPADEKKDEKAAAAGKTPDVKIDLTRIGQRILALPMPPRRYDGLQAGKAGVLYAIERPDPPPGQPRTATVHRFDLAKRRVDVVLTGLRAFEISHQGEKMLYRKEDRWYIASPRPMAEPGAPPPPPPADPTPLAVSSIEVRVDPRAEWMQMYREAWRLQRDFFYDPGHHGLDLRALEERYERFAKNLGSRRDLNYLFNEMLGQLSAGHIFVGGGDAPEAKKVQTGLLGADYAVENGRYRFTRIYDGENWNPDLKAPLTQPGVNVEAGEYLLAVNGRDLRAGDNIYSRFEGAAGKAVVLRVGGDPSGAGARDVTVIPVADETRLRHLAWVEDNRRKVDRMTGGRVAYVHMPDTSTGGFRSFNRYFYAQIGKEAAIIDDRFNHGGQLATDIIEHLKRPLMSVISPRAGADFAQPQGAIYGPKVMIINEFAGSGGDLMPWYFRRAGVGKLIGKRTWGGVIGMTGSPELIDGGLMTVPSALVWNPSGEWDVENIGVPPDIEVEQDPKLVRQGRDPQLEKAVEVVLEELERNPPPKPKRPPYPRL